MADFKTKLWYGGGPTWRPGRDYSPSRQLSILNRMFGGSNPEGPLLLPDRSPLSVGSYLAEKEDAPMIRIVGGAGFDDNGLDSIEGFLPSAFRKILLLGRASMEAEVSGNDTAETLTWQREVAGSRLIDLVMLQTILGDPEDGVPDGWPEELSDTIFSFLGYRLGLIEVGLPEDHLFDLEERPMERFVVDIDNRFSEILK